MRPETEKLIEEKKAIWPSDRFRDAEVIFLSDLQKIIDCEIKCFKEKQLRDEFAMRAPEEIPAWFIAEYCKSENVKIFERDGMRVIEFRRQDIDSDLAFKWRYYYADAMLKQRG